MTAAAFLLTAGIAMASVTQNGLTINGLTSDKVSLGDTYEGKLTFTNTGNSTVQSVWIEIPGSGFAGECKDVSDQNQTGPHTVTFTGDTTGATEGIWDVKVTVYGTQSPGANNDCDTTVGTNSSHTFQNQLTITDNQDSGGNANNTGGTGSGSSSGSSTDSKLDALIALFTKFFGGSGASSSTPPAPATDPACAAFNAANAGTQPNVYNAGNKALQGFLLSQHIDIPALNANPPATFGFYGNQTTNAVGIFRSMHPTCTA